MTLRSITRRFLFYLLLYFPTQRSTIVATIVGSGGSGRWRQQSMVAPMIVAGGSRWQVAATVGSNTYNSAQCIGNRGGPSFRLVLRSLTTGQVIRGRRSVSALNLRKFST